VGYWFNCTKLAFTKNLGHIQVDTVPTAFKSRVSKINALVVDVIRDDPDSDDDFELSEDRRSISRSYDQRVPQDEMRERG